VLNKVVVRDHDAGNGRQEDRVGGEICRELVRAREQGIRAHYQADSRADVAAATNVQEAREKRRHVCACRDRVRGDVGAELRKSKSRSNQERAEALGRTSIVEEPLEEIQRIPDGLATIDDGGT
jgi:hypothetical protein